MNRRSKSEPEYETQNDSDSAIMLEESFTEVYYLLKFLQVISHFSSSTMDYFFKVSLAVPDIRNLNFGIVINLETPNDDHQVQLPDIKVSR